VYDSEGAVGPGLRADDRQSETRDPGRGSSQAKRRRLIKEDFGGQKKSGKQEKHKGKCSSLGDNELEGGKRAEEGAKGLTEKWSPPMSRKKKMGTADWRAWHKTKAQKKGKKKQWGATTTRRRGKEAMPSERANQTGALTAPGLAMAKGKHYIGTLYQLPT